MGTMRAVIIDPEALFCLGLGEVEEPKPAPLEPLVRVSAISLNLGEVRPAHRKPKRASVQNEHWLGWSTEPPLDYYPLGLRAVAC